MHAAGNLILVRETFSALGDHVTRMAIAPTTTKHARQPRAAFGTETALVSAAANESLRKYNRR